MLDAGHDAAALRGKHRRAAELDVERVLRLAGLANGRGDRSSPRSFGQRVKLGHALRQRCVYAVQGCGERVDVRVTQAQKLSEGSC